MNMDNKPTVFDDTTMAGLQLMALGLTGTIPDVIGHEPLLSGALPFSGGAWELRGKKKQYPIRLGELFYYPEEGGPAISLGYAARLDVGCWAFIKKNGAVTPHSFESVASIVAVNRVWASM